MARDAGTHPQPVQEASEPTPAWDRLTVAQAIRRAERWREKRLLIFPERSLSALQISEESEKLALALLELGVSPGEHVAAWLPNCAELCAVELAVARIGAAMVAFNTRYKAAELAYVLEQSDATVLFVTPRSGKLEFFPTLLEVLPELKTGSGTKVRCARAPRLKQVVAIDESGPGMLTYQQLLEHGSQSSRGSELKQREVAIAPGDAVLLQYTSGTTRFPKAAMLAHGAVLRNAAQMAARAGIDETDRVLSAMPMFHVGGSVCALLGSIVTGATLYMSPIFDPGETLRIIEEEKITAYIGLESMFIALRAHQDFTKRSRASLKKGWTAGTAALLRMVADEIGIQNICPLYGLSEASPNVCICDWRDPLEKRMSTMGRPQAGTEVKVVDPYTGEPLPANAVGEIWVRGYSVMKGYYKDPEATARALDKDGWLHTGDLGRIDDGGYLTWTGRLKDTLRVGGENISAVEVEDLVSSHPDVQAAVVVGVPDDRLTEVPFAFVQLRSGAKLTADELTEYCRARVSGFKVPRYVYFVDSFQMTGSGKIQKFLMKDQAVTLAQQLRR